MLWRKIKWRKKIGTLTALWGLEIVNILLETLTEMETFDWSLEGLKGETTQSYCPRESKRNSEAQGSRYMFRVGTASNEKQHFRPWRYCQFYTTIKNSVSFAWTVFNPLLSETKLKFNDHLLRKTRLWPAPRPSYIPLGPPPLLFRLLLTFDTLKMLVIIF